MLRLIFPKGVPIIKRLFDLILTTAGLIIISPFLALIALIIRICIGSPIFFRQKRPGYLNHIFTIYKFRTMQDVYDDQGKLLPDEQRLTSLGRFLRVTSIDELPELFNVLLGDMSLVGPRPLLVDYLERYSPEQARRHHVMPGITGWAQVNGRNAINWKDKFACDVWYVDHWSFWLDIKILALTFMKVVGREDINQPGQTTSELFMGNSLHDPKSPDTPSIKQNQ